MNDTLQKMRRHWLVKATEDQAISGERSTACGMTGRLMDGDLVVDGKAHTITLHPQHAVCAGCVDTIKRMARHLKKPKLPKKTKGDAVTDLIALTHQPRSLTSAKRIAELCDVLGLTMEDRFVVFMYLSYAKPNGEPYPYGPRNKPLPVLWRKPT